MLLRPSHSHLSRDRIRPGRSVLPPLAASHKAATRLETSRLPCARAVPSDHQAASEAPLAHTHASNAAMLTGARVHAMRPFLLTPASAPAAPSTLSRLLLPLHLQSRNNLRLVHAAPNPHPQNSRASSLLLRHRRGRFFATSSSSQVGWNHLPALPSFLVVFGQVLDQMSPWALTDLAYDSALLFI